MKVPAAKTLDAKGAQTRNATPPGKRMVPMPGRAEGETAVKPTGLSVGIIEFFFEGAVKEDGEQGIQVK